LALGTTGWNAVNGSAVSGVVKLGTESALGYLTSPTMALDGQYTLSFRAAHFASDSKEIDVYFGTTKILSITDLYFGLSPQAVFADLPLYTVTFSASESAQFKFTALNLADNQFYIDDVKIAYISSSVNLSETTNTYTVTGLDPNTEYFYTVTASNACSSTSTESSVTTLLCPVTELSATSSNVTEDSFDLSWDAVPDATGYDLYVYKKTTQTTKTILANWTFPTEADSDLTPTTASPNNTGQVLSTNNIASSGIMSHVREDDYTNYGRSIAGWFYYDFYAEEPYWMVEVNTTGFSGLTISSIQWSNAGAPGDFKLQYSLTGELGEWHDIPNGDIKVQTDYTTGVVANLPLPTECENVSNLYIRWIVPPDVWWDIDGASGYNAINDEGESAIDDILIESTVTVSENSYLSGYNPYTVAATETSHTLENLDANTEYFYIVIAHTSTGCTSTSTEGSTTTCGDLVWNGSAEDNDWNNPLNWTPNLQPHKCSNCIIPKIDNAAHYPILTGSTDDNKAANVYFRAGSEISRHDLLDYDQAYIQYDFGADGLERNQWHLLSMPLQEAITGDFSYGGYPKTFLRKFDTSATPEKSVAMGTWTNAFATQKMLLPAGTGFALWVNGGTTVGYQDIDAGETMGIGKTNGIIDLPFFEDATLSAYHRIHTYTPETKKSTFQYFYNNLTLADQYDDFTRTVGGANFTDDKPYRLNGDVSVNVEFSQVGEAPFALIGNPYMATLDFNAIYSASSNKIKNGYNVWAGNGFAT
jgi:hypothetical protein